MPAELLLRRPDVRTAEMLLAAQSALIGVSAADLYPSIGLVGTVGLSADSLDWSERVTDWAVGPTLTWNVFDWGRLENRVLVEDARGQPPSMPFWLGESLGRSDELCHAVSRLAAPCSRFCLTGAS